MTALDLAYEIIDLHEENLQLRRDLQHMTEQRDYWFEMRKESESRSNDLMRSVLEATLLPALKGKPSPLP